MDMELGVFTLVNYGEITLKLSEIMINKNIKRTKLSKLTGVKYAVINRYYKAENIVRVDLDVLAKICYVLECKIEDILEYVKD